MVYALITSSETILGVSHLACVIYCLSINFFNFASSDFMLMAFWPPNLLLQHDFPTSSLLVFFLSGLMPLWFFHSPLCFLSGMLFWPALARNWAQLLAHALPSSPLFVLVLSLNWFLSGWLLAVSFFSLEH